MQVGQCLVDDLLHAVPVPSEGAHDLRLEVGRPGQASEARASAPASAGAAAGPVGFLALRARGMAASARRARCSRLSSTAVSWAVTSFGRKAAISCGRSTSAVTELRRAIEDAGRPDWPW